MDLDEIRQLIATMEEADLHEVSIKEKGFEITLKRGAPQAASVVQAPVPQPVVAAQPPKETIEIAQVNQKEGVFITSPMVGTYYSSPSPADPMFVKVGDTVSDDTVVCIVEAMKVMNEVKAGVSGRVAEILVSNADPVEFGTQLIRIE